MKFKSLRLIAAADPETAGDLLKALPAPKRMRYAKRLGDLSVFLSACSSHHVATLAREAKEFNVPPMDLVLGLAVHAPAKARDVAKALGIHPTLVEAIQEDGTFKLVMAPQKAISRPGAMDDLFGIAPPKQTVLPLPETILVPGDLILEGWTGTTLPTLVVGRDITLRNMPNLTEVDDLVLGGNLVIDGCPALRRVGKASRLDTQQAPLHSDAAHTIKISRCEALTTIDLGHRASHWSVTLLSLPVLTKVKALAVRSFHAEECSRLTSLQEVGTEGEVSLFNCEEICDLSDNWVRLNGLSASRCPKLLQLPSSLQSIFGDLIVGRKTIIPATLTVRGETHRQP